MKIDLNKIITTPDGYMNIEHKGEVKQFWVPKDFKPYEGMEEQAYYHTKFECITIWPEGTKVGNPFAKK